MLNLLPGVGERLISIYDDNPNEIMPYLKVARVLGVKNIEVVQISHPDAKRKDVDVGIEPRLSYMRGNTRLRHYSPNLPTTQYQITWETTEEMQACHARIIDVPEGMNPEDAAWVFLHYHESYDGMDWFLGSVEKVQPGRSYPQY